MITTHARARPRREVPGPAHPKRRFEAHKSHSCMRNVGALNFVASISHSLIPSNVLIHTTLQLLLRLAIWLTVCFEEISIQTLLELTAALTLCSFNKHQNVNWCSKSDFLFVIQRCKCYAWFIVSHPSICGGVALRSGGQQGGRRDSRRVARWAPKTRPKSDMWIQHKEFPNGIYPCWDSSEIG